MLDRGRPLSISSAVAGRSERNIAVSFLGGFLVAFCSRSSDEVRRPGAGAASRGSMTSSMKPSWRPRTGSSKRAR